MTSASLVRQTEGQSQAVTEGIRIRRASASWWRGYTLVLGAMDTLAIVAGALVASQLRFGNLDTLSPFSDRFSYTVIALALIPAWLITLTLCGTYERRFLEVGADEYRRVFSAALRFIGAVATAAFVLRADVARGFVAIAIPVATAGAIAGRYVARRWLHRRRGRQQSCMKSCLIVGSEQGISELVRALRNAPFVGYAVAGACTPRGEGTIGIDDGLPIPVVAGTESILESAHRTDADAIVVADGSALPEGALPALAWQLEGTGIELLVAPSVTDVAGPRISIRPVAGLPLVHVEEPELSGVRRMVKNAFDRSLAAVCLIILSPVLLATAAVIRVICGGPALFRQVRIGVGGRRFVLWKFRTMSVDAEQRLAQVAHLNEHDGLLFKMVDDPRITPLGRVLRRWSIDELPQLWNVVRGEMSIVGPRPPLPTEVERYDNRIRRRLLVKPGLTGLWQVSGRAQLTWDEAVRLDLYYVENWSPSLDAVILAKTVVAVLRRQGAS